MPETHLFVGPTAHGMPAATVEDSGVIRHPPVQRGGVRHLVETRAPADIVIVDGRFGDVLAVGHRELVDALDLGWRIWGVGSIGAVRAAELCGEGMVGHGSVYEYFARTDAPDDEVAVLHGPEPDYRPVTEALVDLRCALEALVRRGEMSDDDAVWISTKLAHSWFGERSLPALVEHCRRVGGDPCASAARQVADDMQRYRLKSRDLQRFLEESPWRSPS